VSDVDQAGEGPDRAPRGKRLLTTCREGECRQIRLARIGPKYSFRAQRFYFFSSSSTMDGRVGDDDVAERQMQARRHCRFPSSGVWVSSDRAARVKFEVYRHLVARDFSQQPPGPWSRRGIPRKCVMTRACRSGRVTQRTVWIGSP